MGSNAAPPAVEKKEKPGKRRSEGSFSFCELCRLNHDQGPRHKYFPAHRRAVDAVLSRFRAKLADLRFFLRQPSSLRPEHSDRACLWCVFCALDLREIGSCFACANAISHLASEEHRKNVKDFLWKHGGGMDQVDAFVVSEAQLLKWEKGCESLKTAAQSSIEGSIGPQFDPPKDIQIEVTANNRDNYASTYIKSFSSNVTYDVMPLQNATNEKHQGTCTAFSETSTSGPVSYFASTAAGRQDRRGVPGPCAFPSSHGNYRGNHSTNHGNSTTASDSQSLRSGKDQGSYSESEFNAVKSLTSALLPHECSKANVHTGAPPPWLEANEEIEKVSQVSRLNSCVTSSASKGKSRRLNPKRVGAAWAEKRRAELEMERKGEVAVSTISDSNWLPNFGRVWQSGTRKESRKEFEKENRELRKNDDDSEPSFPLRPYISKRMRAGAGKVGEHNGPVEP